MLVGDKKNPLFPESSHAIINKGFLLSGFSDAVTIFLLVLYYRELFYSSSFFSSLPPLLVANVPFL